MELNLNECINFLFSKSQQKVQQITKAKLKPYEITPVQYGVLHLLWEKDGQFASELASTLHIDAATLCGIIDRLENKGFIVRKSDDKDRRVNRIYLTPTGEALKVNLIKIMKEINEVTLEKYNESERHLIIKFLREISEIGN